MEQQRRMTLRRRESVWHWERTEVRKRVLAFLQTLLISSTSPLAYVYNFKLKELQSILKQDTKNQKGMDVQHQSFFFNFVSRLGGFSTPCPDRFISPEKTRFPLKRRLTEKTKAGLKGWWKISIPLGFDPRTVQPVANRDTDWAILGDLPAVTVRCGIWTEFLSC